MSKPEILDPLNLPRWWDEHSELDEIVSDVCAKLASDSLERTRAAVAAFEETLDAHFSVEESVYFPLIERYSPDDAQALRAARQGHERIRSTLDDLQESLASGDRRSAQRMLARFLDGFREHEAHEEKLIQRLERIARSA